jgi:protein involved in polysaccharide export with SLBB domain
VGKDRAIIDPLNCRGISKLAPALSLMVLATMLLASLGVLSAQVPPTENPAQQPRPLLKEYRLEPGDELSVMFPFNAELNHDGPIGPDGRFTLPLVGTLYFAGDTVSQATLKISTALRTYGIVEDAHPSLTVRKYNASVFVGGEVKQPGTFLLTSGMDPLQAVIAAGGMLDTAKTRRIAIIRRAPDGHALISYVDLKAYTRGGSAKIAPLEPHDVVFVPKSSIAEADAWVDQYLNKLLPFGKSFNYNLGNYGTTTVAP